MNRATSHNNRYAVRFAHANAFSTSQTTKPLSEKHIYPLRGRKNAIQHILEELKSLSNPKAIEGTWQSMELHPRKPMGCQSQNSERLPGKQEIQKIDSRSTKWIASDAIRELTSKAVQERL